MLGSEDTRGCVGGSYAELLRESGDMSDGRLGRCDLRSRATRQDLQQQIPSLQDLLGA